MKKQLLFCFVLAVTASAFAKNAYWGDLSGRWQDSSSWSGGYVPQSIDDPAIFNHFGLAPFSVTFDAGSEAVAMYVDLYSPTDPVTGKTATDNYGPFESTVTFAGNGQDLYLKQGFSVNLRRKVIVDNLHISGNSYFNIFGKIVMRNGASWTYRGGEDYGGTKRAGAEYLIDNASAQHFAYAFTAGSKATVKNGGYIGWDRHYVQDIYSENMWGVDWNVIDGVVSNAGAYACWTAGFFPKRSGEFASNQKLMPNNPPNAKWRLGGKVELYNNSWSANSALTMTNNVTIYGGGELMMRYFNGSPGTTNIFDLSAMSVSVGYKPWSTDPVDSFKIFLGNTHFYAWSSPNETWAATKTPMVDGGAPSYWRGDNTFHCVASDAAAYGQSRQWTIFCAGGPIEDCNSISPSATFTFVDGLAKGSIAEATRGGQMQTCTLLNGTYIGGITVGDDTTVRMYANYFQKVLVHDLTLGKNARLDTLYRGNVLYSTGEVKVDPTAKFILQGADQYEEPVPMFCTLDDQPDGIVERGGGLSEGFQIDHVEGCFFCWKGSYNASISRYIWGGWKNNLWSEKGNWCGEVLPSAERGTIFSLCNNTISRNDIEGLVTPYIRFAKPCGPFRLYGNPVKLTSTEVDSVTSAVANGTAFPQIVDLDLSSDEAVFGVTSDCTSSGVFAPICLRGKVDVPNGAFAPTGPIVIDGTLNAKELTLLNVTKSYKTTYDVVPERFPTVLTVRKTGTINISDQVAAHSTTSSFWIAKGGRVNIYGDWVSTGVENEHTIHGLFNVAGALGGTKSQLYVGKGTLRARTTDGSGGAKLRIGEGLTLSPASSDFGTMPVEIAYGSVTLAPTEAGTMPQDVEVSSLGAVVTVTNDQSFTLGGKWQGYDFDLVKKGSGRLTLGNDFDSSGRGYVTVEQGTLAYAKTLNVAKLIAKPGTVLAFGATDGEVAELVLGDSIDLDDVTITSAEPSAVGKYSTILTVPENCTITGTPKLGQGLSVQIVVNEDGTTSLQGKLLRGLSISVNY